MGNNIFVGIGENDEFKCFQCRSYLSEGFMCENDIRKTLCINCQEGFNMIKCKHDKNGEHKHIKFIRGK